MKLHSQLVGAFGERAAEAELLRRGWRTANFNSSIKNAAHHDLIAEKGGRTIHLRVKTCGIGQNAFQFGSKPEQEISFDDIKDSDYTILVQMGETNKDDVFYVMPTRILRGDINTWRRVHIETKEDLGHWTLRLSDIRGGEDRPNYGFAKKWASYRDNWGSLDP